MADHGETCALRKDAAVPRCSVASKGAGVSEQSRRCLIRPDLWLCLPGQRRWFLLRSIELLAANE
jgi:hypothetical protein